MASALLPEIPAPGFSFENFNRNESLLGKGVKPPKVFSTGTTICGAIYKDGVIFANDKRATGGSIVTSKKCRKLHRIASNIVYCGAGTAGDLDAMEKMVRAHVELHRLNSGKEVPVCVATKKISNHLFRYQGHIGCAIILGGIDKFGPTLCTIYPHGSIDPLMFASMGSGSLAAMSILESNYRQNMSLEEAKLLVRNAIVAGVENDLASGNGIDICILTKGKMEYIIDYDILEATKPGDRKGSFKFALGTTPILESYIKYEEEETIEKQLDPDRFMETA